MMLSHQATHTEHPKNRQYPVRLRYRKVTVVNQPGFSSVVISGVKSVGIDDLNPDSMILSVSKFDTVIQQQRHRLQLEDTRVARWRWTL